MKFRKIAAAVLAAAVLAATPATVALLSPLVVSASAEDTLAEGDWTYSVNADGETVTITKYNGTDDIVDIPTTLGGKTVTKIGESAFENCKSLTSVTIPNGLTTIGSRAFCNCTLLTSVTIPEGVTTIARNSFSGTSLTSVSIPDSVTTIGDGAFSECTSLENITVGENNTNYSSINGVLFNSDKSELVFYPVGKKDKSYTIPNSVTTIGLCAFANCKFLTSVVIPNSVITIGIDAFYGCTSLTSVTIPDSVTIIDDCAFYICTSLESITVGENNADYSSINGVLFNKDKSELICYPAGMKNKSYTVPDGVTTICDSAFEFCLLTSVIIPDGVTTIGDRAFCNCKLITSVTIPDSVTTIDSHAFALCTSLTNITIPDSVTTIGYGAFSECTSLTSAIIPSSVITINGQTFWRCTSLTSVTISNSVTTIGDGAFDICKSLETVYYGGTKAEWEAVKIGENNFKLINAEIICTDGIINEREPETSEPETSDTSEPTSSDTSEPTSSDISEPISSDPTSSDTSTPTSSDTSEAMSSDTSETEDLQPGDYFVDGDLEYTVLKDGTLEIRGFAGDETREIIIPETVRGKKVTSIGDAAFIDCTSLTSVTVPGSVTKIGGYAFSGCTSLETVNYGGRKSDWEAIDIDIENDALTNAEIKFAETTVEIVDEDTNVKAEISAEDKELDGAEFEADPADHPTLWDLIKKIIEKAVDTIESVTEEAQKSLEEAAEAVKNGKGFAYDMGFKKHGKEVKPDKSVTVSVPVPDKFKNDIDKLNVYHLTNRGAVYVPSWIKDGSIMFKTNSFSPYVITVDTLANAVVDDPANTESSNVSVPDTTTSVPSGTTSNDLNPSTGITMAIAPIAVVAVIAAVVSKKKK